MVFDIKKGWHGKLAMVNMENADELIFTYNSTLKGGIVKIRDSKPDGVLLLLANCRDNKNDTTLAIHELSPCIIYIK